MKYKSGVQCLRRSVAKASLAGCALGIASLLPSPVMAGEAADDWQFGAALYGWFPDIGGHTSLPVGNGDIDVDISTLLDHLKMTFQGSFEFQKGRWGGFTDIVYLDVGEANSRTRNLSFRGQPIPASVTAATDFDLKSLFWTIAASYRIADSENETFDLLGGARLAQLKQSLDWQFTGNFGPIVPPPSTGSRSESVDQWDVVIGGKGRIGFGTSMQWGMPYYFDIGTGDSDLTWQAMLGLSYAFDWGDVGVAWRYLEYDLKPDGPIKDLNFNGPALGVKFRW